MNPTMFRKMRPKQLFQDFCKNRGWRSQNTSLHESFVNSNKLTPEERYRPSFIVDTKFHDLSESLVWVEVKKCNKDGEIRVPKDELTIHSLLNKTRAVYYALYNGANEAFRVVAINSITEHTDEGDYINFDFDVPAKELE